MEKEGIKEIGAGCLETIGAPMSSGTGSGTGSGVVITPDVKYQAYTAASGDTSITDILPEEGEEDVIYRVGRWDGTQVDASKMSEYTWDGTEYVLLRVVDSIGGGVFDVSAYNASGGTLATYADLAAALEDVPDGVKHGGMELCFVRTSDNKYVQWQCTNNEFTTDIIYWVQVGYDQKQTSSIDEEIIFQTGEGDNVAKIDKEGVTTKSVSAKNVKFVSTNGESVNVPISDADNAEEFIEIMTEEDEMIAKFGLNGVMAKEYYTKQGVKLSEFFDKPSCYIAPNGDDHNTGSQDSPFRTIDHALSFGYNAIILKGGVYDDNTIHLNLCKRDVVSIKGVRGERVIFKRRDALIADDGSEELVDGYTNVYKVTVPLGRIYGMLLTNPVIYFDGLNDVNTAISASEAHPCQRGMYYRCDCTKSNMCNSANLSDALDEIEACDIDEYKWYYDSGSNYLYFNRKAPTSTYPLYQPTYGYLQCSANQSVIMSNIEFRYGYVNFDNLNYAHIYNCAAKYVCNDGAFTYNRSVSMTFVNCEASSCNFGAGGDGFNGHNERNQQELYAKYSQVKLIDCWAHDNNDDGYSDHEYSETNIWGGLYEYNGKAGVTPSFGSQCTCNNVLSRQNYSGFIVVGTTENEGGNGCQMICYNCIAENNRRGNTNRGFYVSGTNNRMILYNCMSINNAVGYSTSQNTYADLYNCYSLNCDSAKSNEGTMTCYVGNVVD